MPSPPELREILDLKRKIAEIDERALEGVEKISVLRKDRAKGLKEELDFLEQGLTKREEIIESITARAALEKDPIVQQALFDQALAYERIKKVAGAAKDEAVEYTKALKKQTEAQEEMNQAMSSGAEHMLSLIGLGDKFSDTTLGKMTTAMGGFAFSIAEGGDQLEEMRLRLKKLNVGSKILGAVANSSTQLMMTQDSMASSFLRSTGASMEFSSALKGGSEELREMGINLENAGHATAALFENTTAFKDASQATRVELISFTGVLMDLGVDANATAGSIQTLTKGLGMTESEAMETTESIVHLARSLDMDLNGAMSDFNDLAPRLMEHGENMTEVFEGLLVQSRATGLSMQSLVGIAAQFDTFEGAAQATARLNGILGGPYLNSLNMVYATEEERLQAMRETLDLSGKSFDSMGRLEKRAFASASGFQSVGDAAKFFNTNLDDPVVQERIEREKELAAMARDTQDIMEKLRVTMMSLAISLEPLVDMIKGFAEGFVKLNNAMDGNLGKFVLFGGIAVKTLGFLSALTAKFTQLGMAQLTAARATRFLGRGLLGLGGLGMAATASGGGGGDIMQGILGGAMAGGSVFGVPGAIGGAILGGLKGAFFNEGGTIPAGQTGIVGDGPGGQILPTSELVTGPATVTPMNRLGNSGGGISDADITKLAGLINSNSNRPIELVMDRERVGSIIGDYQSKKSRQALQTKY